MFINIYYTVYVLVHFVHDFLVCKLNLESRVMELWRTHRLPRIISQHRLYKQLFFPERYVNVFIVNEYGNVRLLPS